MGNPAFFENAPEYDFYEKSAMGSRSSQECLDGTLFIFNNNKKKQLSFIRFTLFAILMPLSIIYSDPSMQRRRNGIYAAYAGRVLRENIYAWILRQMFLQRKWWNCKCFTDQWCTGISRLWNATGNIILTNLITLGYT